MNDADFGDFNNLGFRIQLAYLPPLDAVSCTGCDFPFFADAFFNPELGKGTASRPRAEVEKYLQHQLRRQIFCIGEAVLTRVRSLELAVRTEESVVLTELGRFVLTPCPRLSGRSMTNGPECLMTAPLLPCGSDGRGKTNSAVTVIVSNSQTAGPRPAPSAASRKSRLHPPLREAA